MQSNVLESAAREHNVAELERHDDCAGYERDQAPVLVRWVKVAHQYPYFGAERDHGIGIHFSEVKAWWLLLVTWHETSCYYNGLLCTSPGLTMTGTNADRYSIPTYNIIELVMQNSE